MEILGSKPLCKAGNGKRVFLTLHELTYSHKGKQSPYYMVTRGEDIIPTKDKKPDAVIIVAKYFTEPLRLHGPISSASIRLVMTSEYRLPIGCRELSFPAGLIDKADYENTVTVEEAAARAAIREFREETGLALTVKEISKPVYSSAGMTNESSIIVMGTATGTPTNIHCESDEDIEVFLLEHADIKNLMNGHPLPGLENTPISKVAWPFLWGFKQSAINI